MDKNGNRSSTVKRLFQFNKSRTYIYSLDRDNRSDAEIKTDGSKNEGRSKNEEEITEVKEKKKKKRDTWMPGPDWARLNRQWRERKREEKIK